MAYNADSAGRVPSTSPALPIRLPAEQHEEVAGAEASGQSCHILKLANEQLLNILDFVEDDPAKTIKFDQRAYLSQESFKPSPAPSATRAQDLRNWRQTCKRFSEVGTEHQFSRVTIRWTVSEFNRLENIARHPHLACAVKKFSYIVPYFFVDDGASMQEVLPSLNANRGTLDLKDFHRKIREQRSILASKQDQHALFAALKAFRKLQHVQILPVRDVQDEALLTWIRHNRNIANQIHLEWGLACSHSIQTVGEAMVMTGSPCQRFSSPRMIPQSAINLAQPGTFASLVSRLISIELHFEDGPNRLDERMLELSQLLRTTFQESAKRLEHVHIGFPSHQPLSLKLDDIFHGVTWERLIGFGIQGWKLDNDDIINLVSRHSKTLIALRLRDVLLKEGSRWKDLLPMLRSGLRLNWCSLRRIGYAATFDQQWANQGAEIDDPPGIISDSSSEDEDTDEETQDEIQPDVNGNWQQLLHANGPPAGLAPTEGTNVPPHDTEEAISVVASEGYESDGASSVASTHSGYSSGAAQSHQMDFPTFSRTDDPMAACSCNDMRVDLEHAGQYSDNGVEVPNKTRKIWEKWVVGRCLLHDTDATHTERQGTS